MQKTLKIGLIGSSGHCGRALKIMSEDSECKLTSYAPTHPSESLERISRFSCVNEKTTSYKKYEELLNKEELDLVIVDSVYGFHGTVTLAALNKGIPVYCEKPLAKSIKELEEIESVAKRKDLPIVCMFETRSDPVVATAKKLINDGAIGEPILAFGQKSYRLGKRPEWYSDPELYVGTIPWVAIHAIDWTRYMTGFEFEEVSAISARTGPPGPKGLDIAGTIQFKCKEQGSVVITYDYLRPQEAPTHGDDRFRIVGTEGIIDSVEAEKRFHVILKDKGEVDVDMVETTPLFYQMVQALKGRGELPMSTEDAIASNKAALKGQEAITTGRTLKI